MRGFSFAKRSRTISPMAILLRPRIGLKMYWPECCILLAFGTVPPLLALFGYLTLGRAGGLMILGTVLAQFIGLNRSNTKHINNAIRVKTGKQPLDFSTASRLFAWGSLVLALIGALLTLL